VIFALKFAAEFNREGLNGEHQVHVFEVNDHQQSGAAEHQIQGSEAVHLTALRTEAQFVLEVPQITEAAMYSDKDLQAGHQDLLTGHHQDQIIVHHL
jgi:hypothetical protein